MTYFINLQWLGRMQKSDKRRGDRMEVTVQLVAHWLNQLFLTNPGACLQISPGNCSLPMYSIPPYNQCSRFELPTFSSSSLPAQHIDVPTLRWLAPATSYISHRQPVEATYLTRTVYLAITHVKELTAHLPQDDPRSARIIHQSSFEPTSPLCSHHSDWLQLFAINEK